MTETRHTITADEKIAELRQTIAELRAGIEERNRAIDSISHEYHLSMATIAEAQARAEAAEKERDALREREKNDGWYYSRWRHEEKRAAAANQRAEAAEKRCAVLTEALEKI